jgi:hypothetical protein
MTLWRWTRPGFEDALPYSSAVRWRLVLEVAADAAGRSVAMRYRTDLAPPLPSLPIPRRQ